MIGLVSHAPEFKLQRPFDYEVVLGPFVRLVAILCGAFMLRGKDWARLLLLAWILFHVILSVSHSLPEVLMHCLLLAVVAYLLFQPKASEYFKSARAGQTKV